MKKTFRLIITAAVLLLLLNLFNACATPYSPYSWWGNTGYQETFYAPDVVSVSFTGNKTTPYERVHDFALLRAAELALRNNYPYFEVISDKDISTSSVTTTGGSSNTVERTSNKTGEKTTTTTHTPTTSAVEVAPKILLEVKFHNNRPDSGKIYESRFIDGSIRAKYKLN